MINNLEELKEYSEKIASKFPSLASTIRLAAPGYPEIFLKNLSREPIYLPDNYIRVLGLFKLAGVSIGQFNLWPVPFGKDDLIQSLVDANKDTRNPYLGFYEDNSFVEVARLEANIICLSRKGSSSEGEVYLVDISAGPKPIAQKLASSYESFLLLAGNLHDVSMSYEDDEDSGVEEFTSRLSALGVTGSAAYLWNELLEEMLF